MVNRKSRFLSSIIQTCHNMILKALHGEVITPNYILQFYEFDLTTLAECNLEKRYSSYT